MITGMNMSGGPYSQTYNFMSPTSKVQLENGFSDPISQRSPTLVGRDPYMEVVTTLPLQIVGSSEADAWNQYAIFAAFVQQIAAFRLRPDLHPIIFGYQTIAAGAVYYSLCTGTPDGNPNTPIISPPPTPIPDTDGMYRMRGIRVSFKRKGRYINTASTGGTAASATSGTHSAAYSFASDFEMDSPLDHTFVFTGTTITDNPNTAYILAGNPYLTGTGDARSETFTFLPGNRFGADGITFTTVVDSVANTFPFSGVGSTLLRWQATDNLPKSKEGLASDLPVIPAPRNFVAFGIVRSEIAASTATMQFFLRDVSGYSKVSGRVITLAGDGKSQIVNLGAFSIPVPWETSGIFTYGITYQNTSTALSRIWLDGIMIVNLDVASLTCIKVDGKMPPLSYGNPMTYYLEQNYLTALSPSFQGGPAALGGSTYAPAAIGNFHASVRTRRAQAMIFAVGSDSAVAADQARWRWLKATSYNVIFAAYRAGLAPLGV